MKQKFTTSLFTLLFFTSLAQNTLSLELTHLFNGQEFALDQNYTDDQQRVVKITSTRYYLSSIIITHDGGQETPLTDVYILGEGNVSNYPIDSSYDINSVEAIRFDLGVDYDANHGNTSNYPPSHPLGPKTPAMDWGWPSGYFFLVLHGSVDNTGDGTPNKAFQIESFGDILLRNIDSINFYEPIVVEDGHINIPLFVNVDRWFGEMDFATIGFNHGALAPNYTAANNTNNETVFTADIPTNLQELNDEQSSYVYTNYAMPYAPVLFYKLPESTYSMSIVDMQGRRVVKEDGINFEGNYFVKSELPSGMYFAVFTSSNGYQKSHQFTVNR